ncbi:MAG: hypothetical protein M0T74_10475 [Desulfitobacterium hafniense]|nr:hypothetical protein [Desulfitobacterium hafniense]
MQLDQTLLCFPIKKEIKKRLEKVCSYDGLSLDQWLMAALMEAEQRILIKEHGLDNLVWNESKKIFEPKDAE